jgi:3-methyladenine DNA glycosylase/8-oxoguanine DNA glycosylase
MLDGDAFALRLPPGHATAACFGYQARDRFTGAERGDERTLDKALVLAGAVCVLELRHRGDLLHCRVRTADGRAPEREAMAAAHRAVARMLRLDLDPAAAERALCADSRLRPLVRRARGLRPWGTGGAFECLLWAIVGQQVHVTFAQQLRAAVVQLAGARAGDLVAHPEPGDVLRLDAADLTARRFSRAKAGCLLSAAAAVATGELDLAALAAGSAAEADAALQRLRGVGPWTAQYVSMRGLLFGDCLPASDSALAHAAQLAFALPQRPGAAAMQQLAEPFAPHRSLFTFHLWRADSADSGARIRKKGEPQASCSTS